MKVIINGTKVDKTYEQVCEDLGFSASSRFIEVYSCGSIGWSLGKPQEIIALRKAVRDLGYRASKALASARV